MQYVTKSDDHAKTSLNARDADHASARPERHARHARRFWLGVARQSIRYAREWRGRFGGPLHAYAVDQFLAYLVDAEACRDFARTLGSEA